MYKKKINYKIWIISFALVNLIVLIWTLDLVHLFKTTENQEQIPIISPQNKFIKNIPPKSDQFPNDKSPIWNVFENDNEQGNVLPKKENNVVTKKSLNKESKIELTDNKDDDDKVSSDNIPAKITEDRNEIENKNLEKNYLNNKTANYDNNEASYSEVQNDSRMKEIKSEVLPEDKKNNKELKIDEVIDKKYFYVQIASLSRHELVSEEWKRLKKKFNNELKDLIFIIQKAVIKNNKLYFRLLVGKFETKEEAKVFCAKINYGNTCIIRKI